MSEGWKDGAEDRLQAAIAAELIDPGLVDGYVLMASVVELDGDASIAFNCAPGQRLTTTLGLLELARLDAQALARRDGPD